MKPRLVVDIGNTRIKWGLCGADGVQATASLPPDDPQAWQDQLTGWALSGKLSWVVAGVQPKRQERLLQWLHERGDQVRVLDAWQELPLSIRVERPDYVGMDRLVDAVGANRHRRPDAPAVIVDAGSAVTVDWLDETGAFCGGAIFPGLRLMARALHEFTALLPLVETPQQIPSLPGTSTIAAMSAGVFWSVAGGIQAIITRLTKTARRTPDVFLTGGDALLLQPSMDDSVHVRPTLTLEGILAAAEILP